MRITTRALHQKTADLGSRLGFRPGFEVNDTLLRVRLDDDTAYHPRLDVLWSLPLSAKQREALGWALGLDAPSMPQHLPVCGWEVEATTPSTKILAADVANLTALGCPFGFLVVNDDPATGGEARIYARAARMLRTLRYQFGDRTICPVEATWLDAWTRRPWDTPASPAKFPPRRAPTGGEKGEWIGGVRQRFRELGTHAGFIVEESWTSPRHLRAFDCARDGRPKDHFFDQDPRTGERKTITSSKSYFTESIIDLVWTLPLPPAFTTLASELGRLNPALITDGVLDVDRFARVVVLAVEFESSKGKHAGGGLLNLASHGLLGLLATPDAETEAAVARIHRTYQPTLGLRNVFVRRIVP